MTPGDAPAVGGRSGPPGLDLAALTGPPLSAGALYVVATPIGNLEDITLRALRVLRDCTLVAAEDTRRAGQLLSHFGLRKPLLSLFQFNEARRATGIVERLAAGEIVALVSDAGTPAVSDPGGRVVAAVIAAGRRVEPVPGACAAIAALAASGLPTDEFLFMGFLPRKSGARGRQLDRLEAFSGTAVIYESPFRVRKSIAEIAARWPRRPVVVARELTKRFEQWSRGEAAAVEAQLLNSPAKGEFVVLIGPNNRLSSSTAEEELRTEGDDEAGEAGE